jgi:iron-regulated transporter 1
LGIFRSIGSALGIAGALSYTLMERTTGVRSTGLLGLMLQQLFLWLCVVAIWLPGSSFDPHGYYESFVQSEAYTTPYPSSNLTVSSEALAQNGMIWSELSVNGHSALSILVFFCGITLARFGLWIADLSIVQIMQENIPEEERGTVFGVQAALAQFFSVLKDVIVIALPDPRTFGLLVIMSVVFVVAGFFCYVYYMLKTRKKRWQKVNTNISENGNYGEGQKPLLKITGTTKEIVDDSAVCNSPSS